MTDKLVFPKLDGDLSIRVRKWEPDEWPAPPVGVTLLVEIVRPWRFLMWSGVARDWDFPAVRVDSRNGIEAVQAAVDKVAAEYRNLVEAQKFASQLTSQ
jgi:hypothetical protein